MKYDIVLADPAWQYRDKAKAGDRGAECKYPVMSLADLKLLPVQDIAAPRSVLFLWVTMPLLAEGLAVMSAWGFTYKTNAFTWVKRCQNGKWFKGMGRYSRANAELCILGTRGQPLPRVSCGVGSLVEAPRGRHSAKPPEVRDRIVSLFGDRPRVELFARECCEGWGSLGYDIDSQDLRESIPALASAAPPRALALPPQATAPTPKTTPTDCSAPVADTAS